MPLNTATFEVTDSHLVSYYAQEADSPTAAGLHAHVTLNHFYTPYISAPKKLVLCFLYAAQPKTFVFIFKCSEITN